MCNRGATDDQSSKLILFSKCSYICLKAIPAANHLRNGRSVLELNLVCFQIQQNKELLGISLTNFCKKSNLFIRN
jgi:hypothetical protein